MSNLVKIGIVSVIFLFGACTAAQINQAVNEALGGDELTKEQVAAGLKQALEKGVVKGASEASQTNGYFKNQFIKILFPPDAQRVEEKLRQIGLGDEVDKFVLTLNRAAEKAADEAKPIFIDAITSMTIQDAWGILKGDDNAATAYLQRTTSVQLKNRFQPIIQDALNTTSATKYYSDLITTYNKIPFVEKMNPDLDDYATDEAIKGLFFLVAQEEERIRENPVARTTELLKKVFAAQD